MHTENTAAATPEDIETGLFLEAIYLKYGCDFREYSDVHIKRRIRNLLAISGLSNISEMQHQVLYDPSFFETLLQGFSINVTEMFRDPSFYKAVREEVAPALKPLTFVRIWHPGCASGEEIYSMAILLTEESIYEKTRIYATDFNPSILEKARKGAYALDLMKTYTRNYQKSGGQASFADYYAASHDAVILNDSLKKHIHFAEHNLATDSVFGEMDMIVCRNVLIYFTRKLQDRVLKLFADSLRPGGFLCLGSQESLKFSACADDFEPVVDSEKIYRRKTDSADITV